MPRIIAVICLIVASLTYVIGQMKGIGVAFSRFLGNMDGQVFVFFILTVAAAEAAIGLAILVTVFRNRQTINVEELDTLKG